MPALSRLVARVAVWLLSPALLPVLADPRLPGMFTHNAVLQQGRAIPIWGWADPGETVTVEFRGYRRSAEASPAGRWILRLPRQVSGGPDPLVVRGATRSLTLTNVLVGEVWVCSGQSNMEWPLSRAENGEQDIARAGNPLIRLLTVPRLKATAPVEDIQSAWQLCEPATVPGFSAVAFHFGRVLAQTRKVPIGLIHTSWGGSPAEAWMRPDVLEGDPDFKVSILDAYRARVATSQANAADWDREAAELRAQGKQPTRPRPSPGWRPSELYHGMICPLVPYAIRGAIWYQGEANASRADEYARLFPSLIRNWRHDWDQGDFPFLAVQLAPWDRNRKRSLEAITAEPGESSWAELREAQLLATKVLPNVGLAVITDLGEKDDIHPTRKRVVGERLALAARSIAYHEYSLTYSGPVFRYLTISGNQIRLSFDHVGRGLEARGGPLTGFQICGTDRAWVWGDARIDGKRVIVSSPKVPKPVAVRYGWSDFPVVNLYNADGLPASPFRTDNFPLSTQANAAR